MSGGMLQDRSARPKRPSANGPAGDMAWIAVALGTAALATRLGRRRGPMVFALTASAGAAAIGAMRGAQRARGEGTEADQPSVERSITIGRTADELRRCWLDPRTLPRVTAGFATVRSTGAGRLHWKVQGPLGRVHGWDADVVDDGPDGAVGWRANANAPLANDGTVRFRPAPAGRGTVVTLHVRFDPPGGALGDAAVRLFGTTPLELAADGLLRRFKSLVETGEIPTTEHQPAARADTR